MRKPLKLKNIRAQRPQFSAPGGLVFGILGLFGTACAPFGAENLLVRECVLPADQVQTLGGRWPEAPVKLALDSYNSGGWTSSERQAIASAADTWNAFHSASKGLPAFSYGGSADTFTYSSQPRPSSECEVSIVDEYGFIPGGAVVIYKRGSWPHSDNAIAITKSCEPENWTGPGPAPRYMALVDLNYESFFGANAAQPDLETIILHELGHVFGLKHSCEDKPGFPYCSGLSSSHLYVRASLYPQFSFDRFGQGEQKRSLQYNDQGRANCLY